MLALKLTDDVPKPSVERVLAFTNTLCAIAAARVSGRCIGATCLVLQVHARSQRSKVLQSRGPEWSSRTE
jgi:hypothetical protein